eukprot:CAMPEP_0185757910 /NCGR_PEP_ID=MMETSP1174-20130828/16428_1 /TAXON_ID=35687 /ORGANISM="Dictyocha speculum, Strain CCMP1381" /LENGTH=55 /DNA_ID=CAMNT_0028437513 /DNA_START=531 /DNA_END=695 /DNA_ORIENTATION=-
MRAVARGVLVIDACSEAIRLRTTTGRSPTGTSDAPLCASAAAAKKSGNITPPGKP